MIVWLKNSQVIQVYIKDLI